MNNKTAQEITAVFETYRANKGIMQVIEKEAREKVASDIRTKTGSGTTEKAVFLLLSNGHDKTIQERFDKYVQAGLVGVFMAFKGGSAK